MGFYCNSVFVQSTIIIIATSKYISSIKTSGEKENGL